MPRLPSSGFCGWLGASHISSLALGVVVDHQLDRIEHADAPLRALVQILAHAVLEDRVVDPGVGFGHADAIREQAEALRRVAAPARAHQRGHARIVPAVDVLFLHQLNQLALGEHDVGQIEPRELDLLRQRLLAECRSRPAAR